MGPPGLVTVPTVLCEALGGVVGLGAEPDCGLALPELLEAAFAELFDFAGGESLIDPATGRPEPCGDDPEAGGSTIAEDCDSAAPPGVT